MASLGMTQHNSLSLLAEILCAWRQVKREGPLSKRTPQWLLFNDRRVEPATQEEVLQLAGWQKAPCIVCYSQVSEPSTALLCGQTASSQLCSRLTAAGWQAAVLYCSSYGSSCAKPEQGMATRHQP